MVVEGWLARAAAARPAAHGARRRPQGSWSYAELLAAARCGARRARRARRRPGASASRSRCRRASLRPGAARLPAARRGRGAGRPAPVAGRARALIADGAACCVDEPLRPARRATRRARRRSTRAHDLDATAVVIHTSGTTSAPRPVELTYGNFLWSALGSAVALGLDPRERWLCALPLVARRRPVDPAALGDLRHHRGRARALRHRPRAARAARARTITLVSLVATTLARLLDAGLAAPAGAALRADRRRPGAGRAARARARGGVPVSLTYGLTEACSQVTTTPGRGDRRADATSAGPPLFCTRVRIAADGEILVRGPDRRARRARAPTAGCTPAISGALDEHGRAARHRAQGRHDRQRRRERRAGRGRGGARGPPRRARGGGLGRADPQWGEAVTRDRRARGPGACSTGETLRAHCAARLAPYKVPKRFVLAASRCRARARASCCAGSSR